MSLSKDCSQYLDKILYILYTFNIIYPLDQPKVTAGRDNCILTCCPSVRPSVRTSALFSNLEKQKTTKQCSLLAWLWIWPSGSLMTPVLFYLILHILLFDTWEVCNMTRFLGFHARFLGFHEQRIAIMQRQHRRVVCTQTGERFPPRGGGGLKMKKKTSQQLIKRIQLFWNFIGGSPLPLTLVHMYVCTLVCGLLPFQVNADQS